MIFTARIENKYLINYSTYERILNDLAPFTSLDKNGNKTGCYRVHSLYFDSKDHKIYYEKVNGEENRKKLRLRAYYDLNSKKPKEVKFEIKKRVSGTVSKIKFHLTEVQARNFIEFPNLNKWDPEKLNVKDKKALEQIVSFLHLYKLKPSIVIAYQRQAFIGKYHPNLRITFDTKLTYRKGSYDLSQRSYDGYIVPPNYVVLEIKFNGMFPSWISNLVAKYNLQNQTFSKYCNGLMPFLEPIKN